jgi:hypothetical protein
VYYSSPIYRQRNYFLTPGTALVTAGLTANLFVRPAYRSYYFGDYYATHHFHDGIYPWYAFHGSRWGYDPLYAHAAAHHLLTDPQWANHLYDRYHDLQAHPEARPAHTLEESRRLAARPATGAAGAATTAASQPPLARSLHELGTAQGAQSKSAQTGNHNSGFQKLTEAQRQEHANRAAQTHQFAIARKQRELAAQHSTPAKGQSGPRHLQASRSPLSAHAGAAHHAPPIPHHPPAAHIAKPAAHHRPEPHPAAHPAPHHHAAAHSAAAKRK